VPVPLRGTLASEEENVVSAQPPLKFLHCADLYLDSPLEGVQALETDVAATLRRATFAAFERAVEVAIEEACDFVVIAGNVYDAGYHSLRAQLRFAEVLHRLTDRGIACYVAHGPADPASAWEAAAPLPAGVHRFATDCEGVTFTRDGQDVARICGVSWQSPSARGDLDGLLGQRQDGLFSLAVVSVGADESVPLNEPEAGGLDYWALGGTGRPWVLHQGAPWVVQAGSPQGRSVAATGPRGCYVVSVADGAVAECRFVPTAAVLWFDEGLDVSDYARRDGVIDGAFTKREEVRTLAAGVPALLSLRLVGKSTAESSLRRMDPEHDLAAQLRDGEDERPDFVWPAAVTVATTPAVDVAQRRLVEDLVGDFLRSTEAIRQADDPDAAIRAALADHPEYRAVAAFLANLNRDELRAVLAGAEALGLELLLGEAR
jgi:DNA repair protein SbcD/Mre11